jgi:hypothetical protein
VDVTTYSAHDEVYGMIVSVDGKGDKGYVEDYHPDAEKTYRVSFWFHPGDMYLAAKSSHVIFQAVGSSLGDTGDDATVIEVELMQKKGKRLMLRAASYSDSPMKPKRYTTRSIRIDDSGWNHVLLEWRASTSDSSPNGFTRLSIIGGRRAGSAVEIADRVPDQLHAIDKARMGVVTGVDASTFGSCYFDTFESFRTLAEK